MKRLNNLGVLFTAMRDIDLYSNLCTRPMRSFAPEHLIGSVSESCTWPSLAP